MKKWVFFDLDGTLTDPMIGITSAVQYALAQYGIEVKYLKELTPFIGPPLKDSFMEFYGFTEEQAQEAIGYYREYFGAKGLYENEVYPGIKEMLVRLERIGLNLAVATSKPTEYSEQILRHFGLKEHFIVVVGSEFDGRRSDKAEVIDYVLRRAQIDASEAIMVGDRKHDMIGAGKCKVESIGVLYGYGDREELETAGADHIAASVEEVESRIREILEREIALNDRQNRRLMSWNRSRRDEEMNLAEAFGGRVRFAILGDDGQAERFYLANRFGKQFALHAVCADTMARAIAFAGRKGRVTCFEDVGDLAACQEVDAVYISGPVGERCQKAITLLRAGKHVLCEAPMAANSEELKLMFETAREAQVILMESMPAIYAPAFEKTLPYLASLGKVRHATLQNCHGCVAFQQWKRGIVTEEFRPEHKGGAVMEMGVVPLSVMVRLFGEPEDIYASAVTLSNGMDVSGTILLRYEDMIGEVIYSKITDSATPSQIQGEDGAMLIGEIDNIKDLKIARSKVDQSIHFEQSDNIMHHATDAFIRMVRTGMGMEKAEEISRRTMTILEEAARQIRRQD